MPEFTYALAPTIAKLHDDVAERYLPLRSFLEEKLECSVRVVRYGSYADTIAALKTGEADAASLGVRASEQASDEGIIDPLVRIRDSNQTSTYRSVIVVRADSPVVSLDALKDAEFGLVDGQSTSGYVMPRVMLREADIDPDTLSIRILESHRAVAEAVISGEVSAGAMHENYLQPPVAERAVDYARLRVIARSREIPRGPIVVRKDLDPTMRKKMRDALMTVHDENPVAARLILADGQRFTSPERRSAPTLKSIANLAGVSYVTVSRVVNKNGYVSEELRKRIEAIVEEVGYAPNGNARVLLGRQLPLVAVIVSLTDHYTLARVESLRDEFEAARLPMLVFPAGDSLEGSQLGQILRDRRLGAVIVFDAQAKDPLIRNLAMNGIAVFVVSDHANPPGTIPSQDRTLVQDVMSALVVHE